MQGNRTAWLWAVVALLPLGVGCFAPPPEAEARLEEVKRQGEELNAALDGVEERLLGSRAMVSLWEEMRWRHGRVSAVACENAASHIEGIERHLQYQAEKSRRNRRKRRYEAQVPVSATTRTRKSDARNN